MPPRRKVRRPKWIHPPEAGHIAAQFRAAAAQIRQQANQLRSTRGILESTWEGNAKNAFFGDFQSTPEAVDDYAAWLESRAQSIDSMTVEIFEDVWE